MPMPVSPTSNLIPTSCAQSVAEDGHAQRDAAGFGELDGVAQQDLPNICATRRASPSSEMVSAFGMVMATFQPFLARLFEGLITQRGDQAVEPERQPVSARFCPHSISGQIERRPRTMRSKDQRRAAGLVDIVLRGVVDAP